MRMKKILFLCFILLCCNVKSSLHAQEICGFDYKHNQLITKDAAYKEQLEIQNKKISSYIAQQRATTDNNIQANIPPVTIPVVVHVMHTGGAVGSAYNPSDVQIQQAINYLNQVYAGSYAGMEEPVEGGGVVNMGIQFELAKRTPYCGYTNGINRVDMSSYSDYSQYGIQLRTANGMDDRDLKNVARWDNNSYYNIWIVNKIDGEDGISGSGQFTAGYAYFAGAPAEVDGTVMLASQMQEGYKTLPHEIGHALNLYHTFEGSDNRNICPTNIDCDDDGDKVCDTPPVSNNADPVTGNNDFSCRTGQNPCNSNQPYNRNTEENFMAYTNCHSLFTNGQKARALAALNTYRPSLIDLNNLALTPCPQAEVNFTAPSLSINEENATVTDGCRKYTDYAINLSIGKSLSTAGTINLTFGGTAVKGFHYDATTNGNFTTPSNDITFDADDVADKHFLLRVYDDNYEETVNKTIIVGYDITNAGSGLQTGTVNPDLTIHLSESDFSPYTASSGDHEYRVLYQTPLPELFNEAVAQRKTRALYKGSVLRGTGAKPGRINAISFFVNTKRTTAPLTNFKIKLSQTAPSTHLGSLSNGQFTEVLSLPSYSTIAGKNTFTLQNPFYWDGISDIALEICYEGTGGTSVQTDEILVNFQNGLSEVGYLFSNSYSCNQEMQTYSFYNAAYVIPIAEFSIESDGNDIAGTEGASSVNYLGNGGSDHIYSASGEILLSLKNVDATLGCVTTSITQNTPTWQTLGGGTRSGKIVAITPFQNKETARYQADFYFSNDELGGKNPANLTIAKSTANSIAEINSSNTIAGATTHSTFGSQGHVFSTSFTGFSYFFLIDEHVSLPIKLTGFYANADGNNDVLLKWSTASEENNDFFTIEFSKDGVLYNEVSIVASQGNSSSNQYYEYVHQKPGTGILYYRLKQTDIDGRFTYSEVKTVEIKSSSIIIYPVPAKDVITIQYNREINNGFIEIFTADMKRVQQLRVEPFANQQQIPIHLLSNGLYFIRISEANESTMLKFIKQ